MKKLLFLGLFLFAITSLAEADTWVNGYTKRDGTYVGGHYRSSPDGSRSNNWSSWGNTNPHTGKRGYKRRW